jgi:hypothetical protein
MPHAEDRYYTPTSPTMMQYHSGPSSSSSQVKQASGPQVPLQYQQQLPAQLTFTDPTTLLNFMSTLPSPQALLAITSLTISFQPFMLSRQMVHQVGMGVHLLLRYTHNLTHLTLDWADAPSSVLTGTSFRLRAFASPILVDATVIAFLEAQPLLQTLTLGAWGAHLPPYGVIFPASSGAHTDASNSSFYGSFYPSADFSMLAPTPPILSPTALPHLAEFTGHAEVASQLAAGGRPLQSVHLTSGLPQPSSVIGSAAATTGWREIFGGLGESPAGIRSLEVGPLVGGFGLEMLAEIGRHLHDLDYLYVRVRKGAQPVRTLSVYFAFQYSRVDKAWNCRMFSDSNTGKITSRRLLRSNISI